MASEYRLRGRDQFKGIVLKGYEYLRNWNNTAL